MAKRSTRRSSGSKKTTTTAAPAVDTTDDVTTKNTEIVPAVGGCKHCGKDDDHANLLICEQCEKEYHTYCVGLNEVPSGEWLCAACEKANSQASLDSAAAKEAIVAAEDKDGLEKLVLEMSGQFSDRFGEICWAHGGAGFGWWPTCIYDPRLTVGSARHLARKHLGKRHLVYFFECHEAPFTVLRGDKICEWEQGLKNKYDVGRTAKSASVKRGKAFGAALEAAVVELSKPLDKRMDWNHPTNVAGLSDVAEDVDGVDDAPKKQRGGKKPGVSSSKNSSDEELDVESKEDDNFAQKKRKRVSNKVGSTSKVDVVEGDGDSQSEHASVSRGKRKKRPKIDDIDATAVNTEEKNTQRASENVRAFYGMVSSTSEVVDNCAIKAISPPSTEMPNLGEDGTLYCKIILKNDGIFVNIGFVILSSRW